MNYKDTRQYTAKQLEELFSSVRWESAKFPERLARAMKGFSYVRSAWDGDRLVGLIAAMDDGEMTAYIHYLLVSPEYQGRGIGKNCSLRRWSITAATSAWSCMPRGRHRPFILQTDSANWTP